MNFPSSSTLRAAGVGLVAATLLLTACSADPQPRRTTAGATPPPTPSQSSSTPPPPPEPSLLSGRLGQPDQPVMAVKIDNTAKAHPQQGLSKADVVYVEQVEGGVTRLAAIFSSRYPTFVGPVRSARITDIALLRQYGKTGLAYSGSQNKLADNLRRAPLGLVSFDANRSGYRRAGDRPQPYDVIGRFDRLLQRAGKLDKPTQVGYSFGDASAGGKPAKSFTVIYPGARVTGEWSSKGERWLLSMDGRADIAAEGGRLGPTTFIVAYSKVTGSNYYDVNGAQTPLTETVGKGKALIFRDGRVFKGRWSRPKASQPTAYTIKGQQAVLAPGQIWIALLGKGRPVAVG